MNYKEMKKDYLNGSHFFLSELFKNNFDDSGYIDDSLRVVEGHYLTPTFDEMKKLSEEKPALEL